MPLRLPTAASTTRPRWFAPCLWLHRWTGLVTLPFFLVLCLTGSLLIFHDEVDTLLGNRPTAINPGPNTPDAPIDRLAAAAAEAHPGLTPFFLAFDDDAPDRAYLRLAAPGTSDFAHSQLAIVARATAQPLAAPQPERTLTGFLLTLHANWFLGSPGQLFGGLVALLVLVCLGTGVAVHAPFVRRLVFGTVRFGRHPRIVQLDLHNLLGLATLGWALLVTVSGVLLAADAVLVPLWQRTELQRIMDPAAAPAPHPVSLGTAIAAAQRALPAHSVRYAFYPGTEFSGPGHYAVALARPHRYDRQIVDIAAVDASTGRVTATRGVPPYLAAILVAAPLHFGNYGGWPLKLFWLASTAGVLYVTANGAWLWWQHRRRPQPPPRA